MVEIMSSNRIFIKIAAYRDQELIPTVLDCLKKADNPCRLSFGICWQHEENEQFPRELVGSQFRVRPFHWRDSKGLGWARNQTQQLYEGEEYALQLDAHHRFRQGWDEDLITMLESTGVPLPILTTHPPGYLPDGSMALRYEPTLIHALEFTALGTIRYGNKVIPDWEHLDSPTKARFMAGGFYFTRGRHCLDYSYDPEMYFGEEEICLATRSFTMGYDFFHPHRTVLWHYYHNDRFQDHSKDHSPEAATRGEIEISGIERQRYGRKRLWQLLGMEDFGIDLGAYGLGTKRTIHQYEKYAGINFKKQLLHNDAIHGVEPPCLTNHFKKSYSKVRTIKLDVDINKINQIRDSNILLIGLVDYAGNVLFSKKLTGKSIYTAISTGVLKYDVVLRPKSRLSSWFVAVKCQSGWTSPIFVKIKDYN